MVVGTTRTCYCHYLGRPRLHSNPPALPIIASRWWTWTWCLNCTFHNKLWEGGESRGEHTGWHRSINLWHGERRNCRPRKNAKKCFALRTLFPPPLLAGCCTARGRHMLLANVHRVNQGNGILNTVLLGRNYPHNNTSQSAFV